MRQRAERTEAFTLIELLIVIAIIAILALIAVPNFLEAQVRSKVARTYADMRSCSTAIQSYHFDLGSAPIGYQEGHNLGIWVDGVGDLDTRWWAWRQLTTPIQYLTTIPIDTFADQGGGFTNTAGRDRPHPYYHFYKNQSLWRSNPATNHRIAYEKGYQWVLRTVGPSKHAGPPWQFDILGGQVVNKVYDPTNGTVSIGFILCTNAGFYDGSK